MLLSLTGSSGIWNQQLSYELVDGISAVLIRSQFTNSGSKSAQLTLLDSIRADRTFEYGIDEELNLIWWYDKWFGQAYGVYSESHRVKDNQASRRRFAQITYEPATNVPQQVAAGETYELVRYLIPAASLTELKGITRQLKKERAASLSWKVRDQLGVVKGAHVTFHQNGKRHSWARTSNQGMLETIIVPGNYEVTIEATGRKAHSLSLKLTEDDRQEIVMQEPGLIQLAVTDETNKEIPVKVQLTGINGTTSPDFGPDSGEHAIKNVFYSATGKDLFEISPGQYDVILSRGPEYDAIFQSIQVEQGKATTPVRETHSIR